MQSDQYILHKQKDSRHETVDLYSWCNYLYFVWFGIERSNLAFLSPLPTPVNIIQKFGPQDSQESALKVSGTVTVIPVNSYGYRLDILNMVDSTNSAYFNSLGQRGYELVAILPYRGNIAPATSSPFLVVWKKHN